MSTHEPDFTPLLAALYGGKAPAGSLTQLKGDASTRRYYRFATRELEPASVIIMYLPQASDALAAGRAQAEAFLDVQAFFATHGIAVPRVYAHDLDRGYMLLEDLGDETFEARLLREGEAAWPALYAQAIDLLADMHTRFAPSAALSGSDCIAYARVFDAKLLRWELDHFREYGLEASVGVLAADARAQLDACFDALTAAIVALPSGFVHRDYQSRNLMWARDGRLVVIDFQDAFVGPAPYDLVALLCDSYVTLSAELQDALLARYARRRAFSPAQTEALVHGFRLIAVQRKLKDAGRFVFIDRVRKNPDFLPYFTQSLRYAARALEQLPELSHLRSLLLSLMPGFPELAAP